MKLHLLNHMDCKSLAGYLLGRLLLCALILAAIGIGIATGTAEATVKGELAWSYKDFEASEDGETVNETNQFTQKYSVYWDKTGLLKGGRLGYYDVGLGYHWLATKYTLNDAEDDVTAGKLLYNGEIRIAPGALPFRLHAYSRDAQGASVSSAILGTTILEPRFERFFGAGERRFSGLNFMVGIRNGNYLGQYREIFAKYPRVFLDYKEVYIHETTGFSQQHSIFRDLAFVSLNKKDNWFHYRKKQFKDYNLEGNDFEETAYILGSIDHHLMRQWINLTNWIKISVSGSLTQSYDQTLLNDDQNSDLYAVDLFSQMSYDRIRISSFSNFSRERTVARLGKRYELPVYADGQISPDLAWRSSIIKYSSESDNLNKAAAERDDLEEGTYAAGQLEMGRRAKMSLIAKLDIENRKTELSDGSALRLRLETFNNRAYQRKSSYALSYSISYQKGEKNDEDINYVEQTLLGHYERQMAPSHKLIAEQGFVYSPEDSAGHLMSYILFDASRSLSFSSASPNSTSSSLFRSTSTLSLESRLSARLLNTFTSSLQWLDSGKEQDWVAFLEQKLRYNRSVLTFEAKNSLISGSTLSSGSVPSLKATARSDGGYVSVADNHAPDVIFVHDSRWTYEPNIHFKSSLSLGLNWLSMDNGDAYLAKIDQRNRYTFYTPRGVRRQFATLYNEMEYNFSKSNDSRLYYLRFLLGGTYSPYRILQLGIDFAYEDYGSDNLNTYKIRTMARLNFPKVQCQASYSYGLGQDGQVFAGDRKEHLIEAEVRKQF